MKIYEVIFLETIAGQMRGNVTRKKDNSKGLWQLAIYLLLSSAFDSKALKERCCGFPVIDLQGGVPDIRYLIII